MMNRGRFMVAGVLALGLLACGGGEKPVKDPTPVVDQKPKNVEDEWRKQALSLSVEGYMFKGPLEPSDTSWSGSAAWVAPDLAVTNAHVALRAKRIVGKDDFGTEFVFDKIVAIDEGADLAIIKTASTHQGPSVAMVTRPADPRSLRGTDIKVIGNTGGLGLSFYKGRITNVVEEHDSPVLLHDANTAGGASGGPLLEASSGKLVGVNHSSRPSLNAKAAAPSWAVEALLERARAGRALSFAEAFKTVEMPVDWYVERAFCLRPGQAFKSVFETVATNDLVASITPTRAGVLGFFLIRGDGKELAKQPITGPAQGAWTLLAKGGYVYAIVNPKAARSEACATVKFGRIDWSKRLK